MSADDGRPPDRAGPDLRTVHAAVALATRAPSVHNTQPWLLRITGDQIAVHADDERWLPRTDPDRRDLHLSVGALLQHLTAALRAFGCAGAVRQPRHHLGPEPIASVTLDPHQTTDDDVRTASAIMVRRSDRRPFTRRPVGGKALGLLQEAAATQDALLTPVVGLRRRRGLERAVSEAADRQESDPGYQTELALWTGRGHHDDGIPAGNLLAPVGRPWRGSRRFTPGDILLPIGTAPDHATVLVLSTSEDDPQSWLAAGRALGAVLLEATALGMASCCVSQPLELASSRRRIEHEVLDGRSRPQILLRVGWAQQGLPLPPTPRRPLSEVVLQSEPPTGRAQPEE